LHIYKLITGTK